METRKKKSFKRLFAFLMAFVMVTTLAVSAVFAAPRFSDVPESHEFYEYIEFLAAEEVVSGYGASGKYYGPDDLLTRAQAAKMIALAAKYEDSDGKDSKFTDVDADTDMAEQIWALEEKEVVKGWGGTNEYKPDRDITRGHVAVMLQRVFKLKRGATVPAFTDLPANDPEVKAAIEVLASNNIVSGFKGTTLFKPDDPVTRGQFAKMVAGAMEAAGPLTVKTVEATTSQILSVNTAQFLEFTINGGKKITVTQLESAGYEVKFSTTLSTGDTPLVNEAGMVTNAATGEYKAKFEYRVTILEDDEKVAESDWKEVKVFNANEAVGIAEVVVKQNNVKVDFLTKGESNAVFVVTKMKLADGRVVLKGKEDPELVLDLESAESVNSSIAYYASDNIHATAPGTVNFKLTYEDADDVEYKITVPVVVKDTQAAKTAVLKDPAQKYARSVSSDVKILIKDQNGDVMKDAAVAALVDLKAYIKHSTDAKYPTTSNANITYSEKVGSIAYTFAALGKYSIKVVHTVAAKEVTLGEFTVEVVNTALYKPVYTLGLNILSDEAIDLWHLLTDEGDVKAPENYPGKEVIIDIDASLGGVPVDIYSTGEDEDKNLLALSVPGEGLSGDYVRVAVGNNAIYSFVYATEDDTSTPIIGIKVEPKADTEGERVFLTKVGTVKLEIVRKTGSKLDVLTSFNVDAINTIPQVENLWHLSSNPEYSSVPNANDLVQEYEDGKLIVVMSSGKFDAKMIKGSPVYIESNEQLRIEIKAEYGGKVFFIDNVTIDDD